MELLADFCRRYVTAPHVVPGKVLMLFELVQRYISTGNINFKFKFFLFVVV